MIPSFGVKKAQPAFQVKAAPPPPPSLTSASVNTAATVADVAGSSKTPSTAALASTSTPLPPAVPPQDAETGECNSDEDFEKENIPIDLKTEKPPTKSKKLKAKKDPNAPKKPTTSYMFFCKQVCLYNFSCVSLLVQCLKERQNVMNELGNIGFTATGAELARR